MSDSEINNSKMNKADEKRKESESFFYQQNELSFQSGESVFSLHELAQHISKPTYIYHLDSVVNRYRFFLKSFSETPSVSSFSAALSAAPSSTHSPSVGGASVLICYAVKANSHPLLLQALAHEGAGADVVSLGELQKALKAGIPANKIVFSGVGKHTTEITYALQVGLKQINVESPAELRKIGRMAQSLNLQARVAFRMNPDVDPVTHPYIKTGFRENKFGMDASFLPELESILKEYPQELFLVGLTLHVGSQLRDLSPMRDAIRKVIPLYLRLKDQGYPLTTFDIGGGLGIDYHSSDESTELNDVHLYGQDVQILLKDLNCEIICEPGRILVARAGVLLSEVQYIKETPFKRFAILNTGMHHLLRPALYEAYHRILPVLVEEREKRGKNNKVYDVVGPICESADVLGRDRLLPVLNEGDKLAIMDVGAYGAVMSSAYNSHESPNEWVYWQGKEYRSQSSP